MSGNEFADRYPHLVGGSAFMLCGLMFRIRRGRKHPDDLVLEWATPDGWRPITFAPVGLMVEFLYRNEDVLYPRTNGYKGGEKVMAYLRECLKVGHDDAWRNLEWEKRNKSTLFDAGDAA